MKEKQRLYKDERVFGYMIFSIIILHNPCGDKFSIHLRV